ncbi:MAG: hypothetical protein Q7S22_05820 [Candidatus Micrarchaeota archaeon]|nr:hypothetical protein [Candidatus Micrarchaeota archaeon]
MKIFVIVVMLFLVMGIMFAESEATSRENSVLTVEKRMQNVERNRMQNNTGSNRVDSSNTRKEMMQNARERMMNRSEIMANVKELAKDRCETTDNEGVKAKCRQAVENVRECKSDDDVNATLCKRNLVAEAARDMVRKRQDLNEECRSMMAENRSFCERRINAMFMNETHAKFLQYVRNRTNETSDKLNDSERGTIKEKHDEKMKEVEGINSSAKYKLRERLTNAIEEREKVAVRMDAFITKAKEKGHETTDLEFLLKEYNDALSNAKTYQENGQYRDAVGAVQEANKIFSEFKRTVEQIVKEHKENRRHEVNTETAFTDTELNSTDG